MLFISLRYTPCLSAPAFPDYTHCLYSKETKETDL